MAVASEITDIFHSELVSLLKKDGPETGAGTAPLSIDLGRLQFKLARSFGFCYGVQNALETAYAALRDCRGQRIFLLSEIIHNPLVNADLKERGVEFLYSNDGAELIPLESLNAGDIVIIPAFGTTAEILTRLSSRRIDPWRYDTTCPFVKRVWKESRQLGESGFSIVIHGKNKHEETRATFSEAQSFGPVVVVENLTEADLLAAYIRGDKNPAGFSRDFSGRVSAGFDPAKDLQKLGIVHQTTMLADETKEIAAALKSALQLRHGEAWKQHWADTRATLCYATQRNQQAVESLIASGGDLAIVVGGYRSSNTAHLYELCRRKLPTYHIESAADLFSRFELRHFDHEAGSAKISNSWLPLSSAVVRVLMTAGASCPDIVVEEALRRISSFFDLEAALQKFAEQISNVEKGTKQLDKGVADR